MFPAPQFFEAWRLTQVVEHPSGLAYATTYVYHVLDNLTKVTQGLQTRNFVYDSRSRLTSAANPESGTVSYGYDNNGNFIWRQNNAGVETCYQYDAANRVTLQVYFTGNPAGGTTGQCSQIPAANFYSNTPNVTYAYDTGATNAAGRLVSVTNSAGVVNQIVSYDALGRVTASSQTISGRTYTFPNYSYNLADAMTSETYPSNRVVSTGYDQANRPNSLTSGSTTYLSSVTYAPHGALAGHVYDNGQLGRLYSYNKRLQPTEMRDGAPTLSGGTVSSIGNPLLDLQYFWGSQTLGGDSPSNNGNLTNQQIATQNPSGSFYQSYTYDSLNRLWSATDTGGWSMQFGSTQSGAGDRYGNIWLSSVSGIPAQPLMPATQSAYNAANQMVGLGYDGNGNQSSFGAYTIGYDAENRQITVSSTQPSLSAAYAYDGTGQRVMKTLAGGATTVYVHDAFGNLAAEYTADGSSSPPCATCYLSADHLGSTRMVADQNGNPVARHDYLPFGGEIPTGLQGGPALGGQRIT